MRPPQRTRAAATAARTSAASVTSQGWSQALPPSPRISAAVSSSLSGVRPISITSAPSDAKRCAVACPMPCPAPVTITPLPSKRRMCATYPLTAPAVRPRMKKRCPIR